jgi:hypothetical protein
LARLKSAVRREIIRRGMQKPGSTLDPRRHLHPVGQFRRHGVQHALHHPARLILAAEVVRDLLTVGPALSAQHLPPCFRAQQVDVAPAQAIATVEPMFDPFGHTLTLEHVYDHINTTGRSVQRRRITKR